MASREFLKIMKNARLGDAFSQHRLGEIYLNGEFDTPKQAANALIWFEKAYRSYKTQNVTESISSIIEAVQKISLTEILSSPSAEFAWECFSNAAKNNNIEAQWQIGKTLIECDGAPITHMLVSKYFDQFFPNTNIREQAKLMLESVASSNSTHAHDAAVLLDAKRPVNEKMQLLWEQWLNNHDRSALQTAADLGFGPAQLTLGLQLARIEQIETDSDLGDQQTGGASLKKAVQWLTLAAKQGERDAWYNLGLIYRRPQFSGYNADESDRCFDHAADLGHPEAQFRKGSLLWRKRARVNQPHGIDHDIPELKASYWVWQAAQQGVEQAIELLPKMLSSCPHATENPWHELALKAKRALDKGAQIRLPGDWVPLCHRIIIGNQFALTKAEMLLVDITKMQHEHCVIVDVRQELPKAQPRLIQIDTLDQRKSLLLANKVFAQAQQDVVSQLEEGNLRQRRYRFDKLSEWLDINF